MSKTIIISLGGSLIVPDEIDTTFIKKFKQVIEEYISQGYRFALICGGGSTARKYQKAASTAGIKDEETLDWIGIQATKLNAFFVQKMFQDHAEAQIITDPTKKLTFKKSLIIASGWEPGKSTDYDAVLIAQQLNISTIINMSNIDYVYDKDPKKHKDAKPLKEISWESFREMVGQEWNPGLNMPFDPVASKHAAEHNYHVHIIGKDIANLKKCIEDKEYRGTLIS